MEFSGILSAGDLQVNYHASVIPSASGHEKINLGLLHCKYSITLIMIAIIIESLFLYEIRSQNTKQWSRL